MLTEAAKKRDLEVCVQTKSCEDPAGLKADHVIEADPLKVKGNKELIKECEKITFENEWIKIEKLNLIGSKNVFLPSLESIQPLVDRISQKKLIERMNLPTPRWISLKKFKSLDDEEIKNWHFPLMVKSYKGGYDGKGNKKINKLLEKSVKEGTSKAASIKGKKIYGKTGTSDGNKDLWFIGSIDNLTTGIWIGYDDNKESELSSGNAAYLWKKFIAEIFRIPIKK